MSSETIIRLIVNEAHLIRLEIRAENIKTRTMILIFYITTMIWITIMGFYVVATR